VEDQFLFGIFTDGANLQSAQKPQTVTTWRLLICQLGVEVSINGGEINFGEGRTVNRHEK